VIIADVTKTMFEGADFEGFAKENKIPENLEFSNYSYEIWKSLALL
jgi:hypothetical protein